MTIDLGSLLRSDCDEKKYLDRRWVGTNNMLAELYAESDDEDEATSTNPLDAGLFTPVLLGGGRPRQAPTAHRHYGGDAVITWKVTKPFSPKMRDAGFQTEALCGAFEKISHTTSNITYTFERMLQSLEDAASHLNVSLAPLTMGLSQFVSLPQGALTEFNKQKPFGVLEEILNTLSASFGAQEEATLRVWQLQQLAREEGSLYNSNSATKLFEFLRSAPALKAPKIFLLDEGNLRAVWKGANGSQCALEFLGNDRVRYVLFFLRNNQVSRNAGNDTLHGIVKQIDAAGLKELVGFA